jgi:hypothetical protein
MFTARLRLFINCWFNILLNLISLGGTMYWKQWIAIFLTMLLLAGCRAFNLDRTAAKPVPEKPLSEMTVHPEKGVSGADSIGDAYIPGLGNTGYDVQQYSLDMEFSTQLDVITATVTISSVVTLDNLGRISLDFSGYQVDGVKAGDHYASYYRSPEKLYIDLPAPYSNSSELVVEVAYHGAITPQESQHMPATSLGLRTFAGKNLAYAMAEPDGAHAWFPCNDHPLDKALYRFEVTVPKGLIAEPMARCSRPSPPNKILHWSNVTHGDLLSHRAGRKLPAYR